MRIRPLRDLVTLKKVDLKSSQQKIIIPDAVKDDQQIGVILEIGEDVKGIKAGDKVVFGKYDAVTVKEGNEEVLIVKEEAILGVAEETENVGNGAEKGCG